MRALPVLEARRDALEKCVFCPKLSRSACPVSNAEPRETITPWGKMSMAYFAANGDVALEASFAAPAWACTGCFACREACDHKNDVAGTLFDARAAVVGARRDAAPPGARKVIDGYARHDEATTAAVAKLATATGARGARVGLLVGCGYVRRAEAEARDAVDAARAIVGEDVALVEGCCGQPLRHAGDGEAFARAVEKLRERAARFEALVVVDPGCAITLRDAGVRYDLLVERGARDLARFGRVAREGEEGPVRWHDPCQLGRGLGVYDAPRAILTRALGRAPDELPSRREKATCSGAGGLLPITMPETARAIAAARVDAHREAGGGRVVTACASSLRALRRAAPQGTAVDDLVTWMARAARTAR